MIRSLVQLLHAGRRVVAALDADGGARLLPDVLSTRALAQEAISRGQLLADFAEQRLGASIDLDDCKLLAPIDHPDPAHLLVSGTGLTHLGSADGRDRMHRAAANGEATDSMRMFLMGYENDAGKPSSDAIGSQPEWFYKGNGSIIANPNETLEKPHFAGDGGEEAEIAGIYLIAPDGVPVRLGFALGNEFSDHQTERVNYLWLAHSKLRQAALGPELRLGPLPADVVGTVRIRRRDRTIWQQSFRTGEANMSHSIRNLEHHHFKYAQFRQPGDVHVHFFGTSTLSCNEGVSVRNGDEFEISAVPFHLPLRNRIRNGRCRGLITVRSG